MNVKEFISMIKDDRKKDVTIYINENNKNLGTIPPGYFTHTEELEKIMSKIGNLEVESFFIGVENPAKAFCFSDLYISLTVTDKVSRSIDSVSNEYLLESLKELHKKVDKLPSCKDIRDIKTDHDNDWSMV